MLSEEGAAASNSRNRFQKFTETIQGMLVDENYHTFLIGNYQLDSSDDGWQDGFGLGIISGCLKQVKSRKEGPGSVLNVTWLRISGPFRYKMFGRQTGKHTTFGLNGLSSYCCLCCCFVQE
jgi:hypothetical protein